VGTTAALPGPVTRVATTGVRRAANATVGTNSLSFCSSLIRPIPDSEFAAEFCERTASVDMSELYAPFLREMPAGGRILDAGCGSGRDSLAFLRKVY